MLAYGICFSLSDLLHSVWQTLGPSTSVQITQFRFILWLSNIQRLQSMGKFILAFMGENKSLDDLSNWQILLRLKPKANKIETLKSLECYSEIQVFCS